MGSSVSTGLARANVAFFLDGRGFGDVGVWSGDAIIVRLERLHCR